MWTDMTRRNVKCVKFLNLIRDVFSFNRGCATGYDRFAWFYWVTPHNYGGNLTRFGQRRFPSTSLPINSLFLNNHIMSHSSIWYELITLLTKPYINPLTPNDDYIGRTAPLTPKRCILYIYSTNIGTEYFKHGIYSPFFPPQNAVCFIILKYVVPVVFTFYIQCVLKLKKNNSGAKRLSNMVVFACSTDQSRPSAPPDALPALLYAAS